MSEQVLDRCDSLMCPFEKRALDAEAALARVTAERDRLRAMLEQIEPLAQRMSLGWLKSEICRLVRAALSDTGRP